MKFQTPLLLLAALVSYVSGEAASRSHVRDFSLEAREPAIQDGYSHVQKRNPVLPPGADANKLHIWIRLDKDPITYRSSGGVSHTELNALLAKLGGAHKDVIVGKGSEFKEYGLQFANAAWVKTHSNGDGAEIDIYAKDYAPSAHGETLTYHGQVKDGRKTLNSIATTASGLGKGHTYNHASYNCETFADALAKALS